MSDGNKKIIVNFFQSIDCEFCKKLKPIIDDLLNENDTIELINVDWEKNQKICKDRNINHVPVISFDIGEYEMKRIYGVKEKQEYQSIIDNLLEIYEYIVTE